jgi:hypothetical protein
MKKVCFVARAESWINAPYNENEYEIWSLTDCYTFIPKADRWFEIHLPNIIENLKPRGFEHLNHLEELNKFDIPVYMIEARPEVKKSIKYPFEQIKEKYPHWWANSLCFMFALAIEEGFTDIYLYGVDMATPYEYEHEMPAIAKWIGFCAAKGINVHVSDESIVKNHKYVYGYEDISREIRRNSVLRCFVGQVPSILDWCNQNLPNIYMEKKQNLLEIIDIKFTRK